MPDPPSTSNRALLADHLSDATARNLVKLVGEEADPGAIADIVATATRARIAELEGTGADADTRLG